MTRAIRPSPTADANPASPDRSTPIADENISSVGIRALGETATAETHSDSHLSPVHTRRELEEALDHDDFDRIGINTVRLTEASTIKNKLAWPYFQDPATGSIIRIRTRMKIPDEKKEAYLEELANLYINTLETSSFPSKSRRAILQINFHPESKILTARGDSGLVFQFACPFSWSLFKGYGMPLDKEPADPKINPQISPIASRNYSLDNLLVRLQGDKKEWLALLDKGIEIQERKCRYPLRFIGKKRLHAYRILRDLLLCYDQPYTFALDPKILHKAEQKLGDFFRESVGKRSLLSRINPIHLEGNTPKVFLDNFRCHLYEDLSSNRLLKFAQSLKPNKSTFASIESFTNYFKVKKQTQWVSITNVIQNSLLSHQPSNQEGDLYLYASHSSYGGKYSTPHVLQSCRLPIPIELSRSLYCLNKKGEVLSQPTPIDFTSTINLINSQSGGSQDIIEPFELSFIECSYKDHNKTHNFFYYKRDDKWYDSRKREEVSWDEVQNAALIMARAIEIRPLVYPLQEIPKGNFDPFLPEPMQKEGFCLYKISNRDDVEETYSLYQQLREYQKEWVFNELFIQAEIKENLDLEQTPLLERFKYELKQFKDAMKKKNIQFTSNHDLIESFFNTLMIDPSEKNNLLLRRPLYDPSLIRDKRFMNKVDLQYLAHATGKTIIAYTLSADSHEQKLHTTAFYPASQSDAEETLHLYSPDATLNHSGLYFPLTPPNSA